MAARRYISMVKCIQTPSLDPQDKHSKLELIEESLQFPETQEDGECQETCSAGQEMAEDGGPREEELTRTSPVLEKEIKRPCGTLYSVVAGKGRCIVYTADGVRFEVPLVFGELLRLSQEEFGFTGSDNKITLPCDAAVMKYTMCLIRRSASTEMEAAFLSSMAMALPCHYDASCVAPNMGVVQHVALCSS